ncbi:RHS repeat-associated core domain-containing protein, partial [Scandinavium lactucae]
DADKLSCNLRFAGQYEDEESGLHYNRFRYYDTETGQYLTPDPIGLAGGVNPYGYVHNPLSWVDPLGLACVCPLFDSKQLQKKFKHAIDFGVSGNANKTGLEAFENAMRTHINLSSTSVIKGTYRWKQDVYHHYDPNTNLDVMTDMDGNFISGWKLSERQVAELEGGGNVF